MRDDMATPLQEPVIIQGPNGPPIRTAVIGCGGTGCNILAEGLVSPTGTTVALGSEPDVMKSLKAHDKFLSGPRELESIARVPGKSPKLAGSRLEADISAAIRDADISFILAGLGGCSGGWAAAVAARAAAVSKVPAFCVASMPFSAEGGIRASRAADQLKSLSALAGGTLVIPNDMILSEAPGIPLNRAFRVMNAVMASPVNMLTCSVGCDDLPLLRKAMLNGTTMAMDSAAWERDNAEFAVIERLEASRWLGLASRQARSGTLFVEGHALFDRLSELGKLFSRVLGGRCPVTVVGAGGGNPGLAVTAVVGF